MYYLDRRHGVQRSHPLPFKPESYGREEKEAIGDLGEIKGDV